jgi:hypothetical protein
MGEKRNVYRVLVGKLEGKRPLVRSRYISFHTFIHSLKFHKILTRLIQPVDVEIVKKEKYKLILLIKTSNCLKKQIYSKQSLLKVVGETLTILR